MAVTLTGNIQLRTGILFFCLIYTLFDREGIMCSSCESVKQELNSFRSVHQLGHCFYITKCFLRLCSDVTFAAVKQDIQQDRRTP